MFIVSWNSCWFLCSSMLMTSRFSTFLFRSKSCRIFRRTIEGGTLSAYSVTISGAWESAGSEGRGDETDSSVPLSVRLDCAPSRMLERRGLYRRFCESGWDRRHAVRGLSTKAKAF